MNYGDGFLILLFGRFNVDLVLASPAIIWAVSFAVGVNRWSFEVPVWGGFVDVVGTKEGKRLAVEVEVSGSQAVQNVEKCVKADFDKICVACFRKPVFLRLQEYVTMKGLKGVVVKMGCGV